MSDFEQEFTVYVDTVEEAISYAPKVGQVWEENGCMVVSATAERVYQDTKVFKVTVKFSPNKVAADEAETK